MKSLFRRVLSMLLVLVLAGSMLPTAYALEDTQPQQEPVVFTQEDYALVDDLFAQIDAMEEAPATKNATETQLADEAAALVMASDNYVEGSLERNGNSFTWWTTEGIRCVYSPRMRQIEKEMVAPEDPIADGAYNEPVATKGGWPSGNQVYLIGPYYGSDSSFTDQYKNEATAIAAAIGDTDGYTLYSGSAATVDKVAEAVSNGAVVIFDSHGSTDYESGYDYVTGANYSYLCLETSSGLTSEDYTDGALYSGGTAFINGAAIANHMATNSPAGIVWMAICLGMATDTLCEPLREKGVEVVYGYSQSVTFAGDYLYEETFWDSMCAGDNVATAIATMKSTWGNWDWSTKIATEYGYDDGYTTISEAREDYAAFPIVVSDEDTHPGQRSSSSYGACSLQTVNSTYTLFSQYNVTAQSSNTAYGTVSGSGSTITATPAEGYYAESATVISGTATVSQNGNTFSVIAQSDCTVQINFAAKTPVTVSFSGASVASQSGYSGDAMTLPTAEAPEGYKFLGWMTSALSEDTTSKPTYITGSFTPTGDTTLYALYSYVDADSGTGTGDYVKVTESRDDWTGEYLIVYEDGGYIFDGSLTDFDGQGNYQSVTITDSTIAAEDGDPYKFTVAAMDNGYSIQGTSGNYIGHTSNANGLTTLPTAQTNTIGMDASGNANIVCAGGAYLRYNSDGQRFRYYKSGSYTNQKAIALYLKDGSAGTTYYTGTPYVCEHANTQDVVAVAATCTTSGYTAGVQCTDCTSYISGHEVVAALGHSYNGVVTAPTATEQGYTTYTCSVCGDSYVGDYVDALGETFYVSFSVPAGITAIETMACANAGITLPTADAPEGYTFAGWSTTTVETTTTKPTILTGSYTAIADVTLYAVYTYTEGGTEGGGSYTLVTDASALTAGAKVVIASNTKGFVAGPVSGKYLTHLTTTFSADQTTITALPEGAIEFTLGGSEGAWTLANADGSLLGAVANKNVAFGSGTTTWSIAISDNDATISSTNTSYGRILYNVGSPRFVNYATSTATSSTMLLPQLYMMSGSAGTTYYTTNVVQCEHTNTTDVAAVAATCTAAGTTAGVYCNDCQTYISGHEVVDALGHSWSDWTETTAPGCETAGEQTRTCSVCGETQTQSVAATGHSYNGVVTAPTETEQGYTTYTCASCGDSYVSDYTPALGVSYTVSFSVPSGVTAVDSLTGNSSGITLPTADAPEGYTFEGWSAVTVQETTEVPTILTGTYVPTANTTLYAVYSREETVAGGGSGDYEKVTAVPSDWSGEYLIVYEDSGYIFNGSLTTLDAVSNYQTVTINDDTISAAAGDPYKFIIAAVDGGYSIQGISGNYIGRSSDSNGMNTGTSALVNTISLDSDGNADIIGSGGAYLRFNATSGQTRFRYYKSSSYSNQKPVALYVKSAGTTTTTYYTTVFENVEAAVYENGAQMGAYATVAEAIAACGEGQYVKLLDNAETELTLEADLLLDLNGFTITGILEPDSHSISCFDSKKDASGVFNCTDVNDQAVVPATIVEVTVDNMTERYMAIAGDQGYTCHYFELAITHMSLKPAYTAVGYKAVFRGDDAVLAQLDADRAFGYTLSLEGAGTVSRWMSADKVASDKAVTLRLQNYDVENYGEATLSAYVSVTLGGVEIRSQVQNMTMRSMVEAINDNYQQYSAEQLAAVKELVLAHQVMQNWNVANLLADPMVQTVNAAYALAAGESMTTTSTLTGVITKIDTVYSSSYQNISVTIAVAGAEDKPILCFRMSGEGADQIGVGDTITVTGTLMNYNGTIEFDSGCTLDSWENTGEDVEKLTDPVEIVTAAYALGVGESIPYEVTLTGTITSVDEAYSTEYGNVTVTITIEGAEDMPIVCFRLKGTGADTIAVGDEITVTGTLKNYDGTIEFISGCQLAG